VLWQLGHFFRGVGSVLAIMPPAESSPPQASVADALASDWDVVSRDLVAVISVGGLIEVTSMGKQKDAGGFPDPGVLGAYEKVLPGSADRLLKAFETQAEHRRKMEADTLALTTRNIRVGQLCGLVIGLVCVLSGATIAALGNEWSGSIIGGGGVIGLVSVFVAGHVAKKPTASE